jgi:hypothetical protein
MSGLLIAFAGEAGTGKDTAASVLTKDYEFVAVALADPLKRICQDVFLFNDDQLWGESQFRNAPDPRYMRGDVEGRTQYLSPRLALQHLGTQWGRHCYPHTWSNYALRVYRLLQRGGYYYDRKSGLCLCSGFGEYVQPKANVVITDVRYEEEVETLKAGGAFIVRIRRNEKSSGLSKELASHSSETELGSLDPNLFDDVIDNNESLEMFKQTVDVRFRSVWLRRIENGLVG